ncbi:MAG TPA: guanylate kinase [Thermodesulfovibrionales bacterium]|nr:guanylate kinase [Thermodesulfovibrionales bacterium]
MKKVKGILFIVSGPSGAGKTTLYKAVISMLPNLKHSVSYTTRPPRPGEVDDRDYTFVSRDEFMAMIDKGEFVERAEIHGKLYGTSKKRLDEIVNSGVDAILDIDIQGAVQLREKYKGGIYIFILPPSLEILKERLRKRLVNSKEEIEKRLKVAVEEIKKYREYDYVIVNKVFEEALKELEAIIISQRASTKSVDPEWIERNFLT